MTKNSTLKRFGLLSLAAMLSAATAAADDRWPWPSERFNPVEQRDVPGRFDYYALVLSWSPTYCSESQRDDDEEQCNRPDGRRFAFVLHGLWPQYERGYPDSCRTPRRPFVPESLIQSQLDMMPSRQLVIHEYRKHGTCSGLDPQSYFSFARQLFTQIRIPDRFRNPFETQYVTPFELAGEFARANPGLKPQSLAIACGGAGNRLKEIRFCFTKDGESRACGDNENARRMCSAERIFVPPVRSTARDDSAGASARPDPRRPFPGQDLDALKRGL